MVTIVIEGTPVQMEVDTGATLSLMNFSTFTSTWPEASAPVIQPTRARLRTYTGEEIVVKGAIDVKVKYREQEADLTLTIVEGDGPMLMGRDWLRYIKLGWAALNDVTQENCSELKALVDSHSALFSEGLGQIQGVRARLHLKGVNLGSSEHVKFPTPCGRG